MLNIIDIKKYFMPSLVVIPMMLHWILPWSRELDLYIDLCGVSFFTPDFLYFLYFFLKERPSNMTAIITRRQACILVLILISILCYSMVQLALKGIDYAATIIVNNLSFVWLTIIYLLRPLTPKELARTRPLMLFALLFLVGEVLLYGFGVLHYTSATNDELLGQDYGGIMRISTTVGAATGTAVVIGLLGAINLTIYKLSMCSRIVLIVVSTIGVFFTMSRGSSLVWAIFLLIYFYMHFFKHYRFAKKVKSTIVLLVCLAAFNSLGGFTPILSRIEHMNSSDDVYASRDSKFEISKKMISESEPWG